MKLLTNWDFLLTWFEQHLIEMQFVTSLILANTEVGGFGLLFFVFLLFSHCFDFKSLVGVLGKIV